MRGYRIAFSREPVCRLRERTRTITLTNFFGSYDFLLSVTGSLHDTEVKFMSLYEYEARSPKVEFQL